MYSSSESEKEIKNEYLDYIFCWQIKKTFFHSTVPVCSPSFTFNNCEWSMKVQKYQYKNSDYFTFHLLRVSPGNAIKVLFTLAIDFMEEMEDYLISKSATKFDYLRTITCIVNFKQNEERGYGLWKHEFEGLMPNDEVLLICRLREPYSEDLTLGKYAVKWLKKKTGPPAVDLTTVDAAKSLIETAEVVVIGFFKNQDGPEAKVFKNVASEMDDFVFSITSTDAVYSELKASKDGVILFKKFDDGRTEYEGELKEEDLKTFLKSNSLPLVVEFTHEAALKIFAGNIKQLNLLFISKASSDYESKIDVYRTVAKEFKNKVLFATVNTDDEDCEIILDFFRIKKEDTPSLRLIKLGARMRKYKPPKTEIAEDAIKNFVKGVLEGKIKQHLLSEDVPEDWDKEAVKVLVGKNFDEVAFDKSKDVLVEFYAPWCGHCKQLASIFDELGKVFKNNTNLVIAKINATANELEHTKILNYPTIKLYRKDTNEVLDFQSSSIEDLKWFTEFFCGEGAAVKEEEEEKDNEKAKCDEL